MENKIYIIGPIGSGKTTLAKKISEKYGHYHGELDYVIYDEAINSSGGVLATEKDRIKRTNDILNKKKWVVEDVGNKLFSNIYEHVELFVILEPKLFIRKYRTIKRLIKRLLKMEEYGFDKNLSLKGRIKFLKSLLKHTKEYENVNNPDFGKNSVLKRLPKSTSLIVLSKKNDIRNLLKERNN